LQRRNEDFVVAQVADIMQFLQDFAPLELAEEWDNVGLLIGSGRRDVRRVLTCLTLTPDVAAEAVAGGVDLIVTHHPVLFRAVQRLTDETSQGRMLLKLIAGRISVYSPHTAFDSAADGINRQLAESLGLHEIQPLRPLAAAGPDSVVAAAHGVGGSTVPLGSGRFGVLTAPLMLKDFNQLVKSALGIQHLQFVGDEDRPIQRVAVACGAAAEFLSDAARHGCDVLLTGEARFHACLEAEAVGVAMVLSGHYASERPAVEGLAAVIGERFGEVECTASAAERDPVQWSM
jgi:dinuclear metal center YbgI/SA1388 family protein